MYTKVFILIILILVILSRFTAELYKRRKEYDSHSVRLIYLVEERNSSCRYSTNRYLLETTRCDLLDTGQILEIIGRVKVASDNSLFSKKRLIVDEIKVIHPKRYSPLYWSSEKNKILARIRHSITEPPKLLLPYPASAVLVSMVFGFKEDIDLKTQQTFRKTGLAHLQAVSGYNFSLLFAGIYRAVKKIARKKGQGILICLFVVGFILLVGGQPSVIRAGLSLITLIASKFLLIRQHNASFSLVIVLVFMLIWNPFWLFDLNFQLSFLATIGIMYLSPIIAHYFCLSRFITTHMPNQYVVQLSCDITNSLAAGIAAAIMTTPLILLYFGETNVLGILLTSGTTFIVSYITQVGFWTLLITPGIILLKLTILLKYWYLATLAIPVDFFLYIINLSARFEFGMITYTTLATQGIILWYCFLIIAVYMFRHLVWKSQISENIGIL